MADRRGPAAHDLHDPELVARAAAGDLATGEVAAAQQLLAACEHCAELAADLRAIAAATRRLPSASTVTPPTSGARDFRLTEADAARLRRRRFPGIGRLNELFGSRSRGVGAALATLGLVGLLVAAGMPALLGGAGGAATASAPSVGALAQKEAATAAPAGVEAAPVAPSAAPLPTDQSFLGATVGPAADSTGANPGTGAASPAPGASGADALRLAADAPDDGARNDGAGAASGWAAVALALVSAVVLVVGLNLLLAGSRGRRTEP